MKWYPIETAPKDGQRVLVNNAEAGLSKYGFGVAIVCWEDSTFDDAGPCWRDREEPLDQEWVTHWMPLPKQPPPDRIDAEGVPCWDAPCEEGLVQIFDDHEWLSLTQQERDEFCALVDSGGEAWPTWPEIPNAA